MTNIELAAELLNSKALCGYRFNVCRATGYSTQHIEVDHSDFGVVNSIFWWPDFPLAIVDFKISISDPDFTTKVFDAMLSTHCIYLV